MELKDVILSTLAEMEEESAQTEEKEQVHVEQPQAEASQDISANISHAQEHEATAHNELMFLNSIRERLLVLFEGFQAPNNSNLEAKIDMTLNFLEYTLATIDERIEIIQKGER